MIDANEFRQLCILYPTLTTLSHALQEQFQRQSQRIVAQDGQTLFEMEDSCSAFVMIKQGSIRVSKPTASGREILLYRVAPGDSCILTVSCLLGHTVYPAQGKAEGELIGYALPQPLFVDLLNQDTAFRAFIFQFFSARIIHLMTLVEDVTFRPMEARLAALLLSKGESIYTTHQQLADELGTVREVVSRHLKEFEGRGWLHLARGQILLLQRAPLNQLAATLA